MKDITIYITHTFHPGEYTRHVAEVLGRKLAERDYDAVVEKVDFRETGWGKALSGRSMREIKKAFNSLDYFDKFNADNTIIIDLHTMKESWSNPKNLKAEELTFCYLNSEEHKERGGWIEYASHRKTLGEGKDAKSLYADNVPNLFSIELPQIYREASGKFLRTINDRINGEVDLFFSKEPVREFGAYFRFVCDRLKTIEKYPPEILAETIANGIEEQILPKLNISIQD